MGDAAGRPCGWRHGATKDFASTDRKFAINIGISFFTPEEFFLNQSAAGYDLGPLDPSRLYESIDDTPIRLLNFEAQEKMLIIFVGPPASGKTTLYQDIFEMHGYHHVNQDILGSYQKCFGKAREIMIRNQSLVIGIYRLNICF